MSLAKALDHNIEDSLDYYQQNIASASALLVSAILEAEEEGLINRSWRGRIDISKMFTFFNQNTEKIEKEWNREFKQLKRIVDYGGYMEYEEMSLILSLRSDLECGLRFVSDGYQELLKQIDENLRSVLELNKEYTRDSRNSNRKYTGGLETYLTKHWWWRYDEDGNGDK